MTDEERRIDDLRLDEQARRMKLYRRTDGKYTSELRCPACGEAVTWDGPPSRGVDLWMAQHLLHVEPCADTGAIAHSLLPAGVKRP